MANLEKKLERRCSICNSSYGVVLGRLDFALFDDCPLSKSFDVVACRDCSFVFYDTPDKVDQFAIFYRDHYFSTMYTSGEQVSSVDAVINIENDPIAIMRPWLKPESSICEVGCGRGALLAKMKKAGYLNLFGVEPSDDCVEFVNKNLGIEAKVGTADNIPYYDQFDLIIATHVFEHVLNLSEAVESISCKLSDNGLAYIEVPNLEEYDSQDQASPIDYITFYEHINHFTISSLDNLFKQHKLSLMEYGRKILNKGTRLPLPAIYGVFKKNGGDKRVESALNVPYDINKISSWLNAYKFPQNDRFKQLATSKTAVYIWGINLPIQKLLSMSLLRECKIAGLLDRDPVKQQKTINGRKIQAPEILKKADNGSVVIIWGGPYKESIEQDVHRIGFKGEIIIV